MFYDHFRTINLQNQSKAIDDLGFTTLLYSGKNFSVIMSGRDMMELHKELVKHLPIYYPY
jgi:hypothetical protein